MPTQRPSSSRASRGSAARGRSASRGTSAFQAGLLQLQLQLFAANQARIDEATDGYSRGFKSYEARYRRTVHGVRGPASLASLLAAARGARAVLVGDYHTLPEAQRAFYRLLRRQHASEPLVVGLEMFAACDQAQLDKLLAGRISEATFLRRTRHAERWPFGGLDSIRPVLDLCRERGWPVLALDEPLGARTSLAARDRRAAARIADALVARPEARALVLFGELHLAPPHLPEAMARALLRRRLAGRVLRVHQSPERIWFEVAASGVPDEHDLLSLGEDAFALISASPVVAQQSFLTWLDRLQSGEEPGAPLSPDQGSQLFRQALKMLGRALGLPTRRALDHVAVEGPAELGFLEELASGGDFTGAELEALEARILDGESFYLPRARLAYLATLSLNHAAEEASHCLRHTLSGEGVDDPRGLVDAFYVRVLNEAVGFLGSKLVNPKRKGPDEDELRARLHGARGGLDHRRLEPPRRGEGLERSAARYVLAHRRMEAGQHLPWLSAVFHASPPLFNAVTHLLGYLLGDRLYYGLVRGAFTAEEARALYWEPFEDEGAAMMRYFELAARVGSVSVPKRS